MAFVNHSAQGNGTMISDNRSSQFILLSYDASKGNKSRDNDDEPRQ